MVEAPPTTFDARQQWPMCPTIGMVYDEGNCGASWALPPVEVMSDSICIESKGQVIVQLSAYNLIACCPKCGKYYVYYFNYFILC